MQRCDLNVAVVSSAAGAVCYWVAEKVLKKGEDTGSTLFSVHFFGSSR